MAQKRSNKIITGAIALAALTAAAGLGFSAYAQDDVSANTNANRPAINRWQNLTDEQKADMEERREEMDARRESVQTALESGNYDTWAAAVKENMGEDAPMLSQITADNFSKFAEAHNYMEQGRAIMEELGIERGGMGFGGGHGRGMGRFGDCPMNEQSE